MKRTCPKGEEGQRWKRGGDCKAEVAPGVSLDGVRRSEKAEDRGGDIRSVCLLLQYLLQSCSRGGWEIVEGMCYERLRAEACTRGLVSPSP